MKTRAYLGVPAVCLAVAFSPGKAGAGTAASPSLAFNPAAVGIAPASAQQLMASFPVSGSETPTASIHYGTDYTAGKVSCTASAGSQTCTVPVTFTPTLPGARKDALFLMDGSTLLFTVYLGGVGQSPLALVQPGVVTQVVSGAIYNQGLTAVDENGTLYGINNGNPAGSNVYSVTKAGVVSTLPIEVVAPTGIGVDGAGILYISNASPATKTTLITWNTVTQTQGSLIVQLPNPYSCAAQAQLAGAAVDAQGNVYTIEQVCQSIIEVKPNGTTVTNAIAPQMDADPQSIAVDSSGNVFVSCADTINELFANGTQSAVATQEDPESGDLQVDAADSLFVIPRQIGGVAELPATNYLVSQASLDPGDTAASEVLGSNAALYVGNLGTSTGVGNGDVDKVDRSQGAIAFGQQTLGTTSAAQEVQLYNGGNESLTISEIALTGASSGFALEPAAPDGCANGQALAPGAFCQIAATLTPSQPGNFNGSIVLSSNSLNKANSTAVVALSGSAPGAYASLSPSQVAFASQAAGTTSPISAVTLSNSGTATLTNIVASLTGANTADFVLESGANVCGSSLAVGSSCSLYIAFTPQAGTNYAATLSVAASSINSPQTATLTGTGTTTVSSVQINVFETVHFADAPLAGSAIIIHIAEAVHIADAPLLTAPVLIRITEAVHIADAPLLSESFTSLNVVEVIHTTDAPLPAPQAKLKIAEIIHTTDAVPSPALQGELQIVEVIHTTDTIVGPLSLQIGEVIQTTDAAAVTLATGMAR